MYQSSRFACHDMPIRKSNMNRKLLLRITVPSVIFGVFLFAACLLTILYIHRLQANLADILAENVTSLQAVQELEIQVRQLRFHTFLYLLDPNSERLRRIEDDQKRFEEALVVVRRVSTSSEEVALRETIEKTYDQYKKEQDDLIA